MSDTRGRRNRAGNSRMRDDEFENGLRPARAIDLCGPVGQRMALQLLGELALAKRPVDDDGDAAIPCQRKNSLFDLAVEDVVSHLHKIERLRAHDLLDVAMASPFRGRDADIADLPGCLHGEWRLR